MATENIVSERQSHSGRLRFARNLALQYARMAFAYADLDWDFVYDLPEEYCNRETQICEVSEKATVSKFLFRFVWGCTVQLEVVGSYIDPTNGRMFWVCPRLAVRLAPQDESKLARSWGNRTHTWVFENPQPMRKVEKSIEDSLTLDKEKFLLDKNEFLSPFWSDLQDKIEITKLSWAVNPEGGNPYLLIHNLQFGLGTKPAATLVIANKVSNRRWMKPRPFILGDSGSDIA